MKKIAIVGYGYVGKATELMFDNLEVLIHDPDLGYTIDNWDGVDYAFICVPTPMDQSGRLDFSYVDSALQSIGNGKIVIRSTIGPDQMINDEWIYMPEFLREATWKEDVENPKSPVVIGINEELHPVICRDDLVSGLKDPLKTVYTMKPKEAAIYKLSRNAMLATKVVFANYLYDACKYAECDFETVIDTFKSENEFGSSHWDVPGPDGKRGFGGKCLPKDTSHFAHVMSKHFSPPNFLNFVLKDNELTR